MRRDDDQFRMTGHTPFRSSHLESAPIALEGEHFARSDAGDDPLGIQHDLAFLVVLELVHILLAICLLRAAVLGDICQCCPLLVTPGHLPVGGI